MAKTCVDQSELVNEGAQIDKLTICHTFTCPSKYLTYIFNIYDIYILNLY